MVMFIHASKLAYLNLPTCLVCPVGRRKGIKSRMLPIDEPSVQQTQDDVLVGKESVRLLFNSSQRTGVAFVMTVLL